MNNLAKCGRILLQLFLFERGKRIEIVSMYRIVDTFIYKDRIWIYDTKIGEKFELLTILLLFVYLNSLGNWR
jgi:hypothetical protein